MIRHIQFSVFTNIPVSWRCCSECNELESSCKTQQKYTNDSYGPYADLSASGEAVRTKDFLDSAPVGCFLCFALFVSWF